MIVSHPLPRRWIYGPATVVAPQGASLRVWHAEALRYDVTAGSETTTGHAVPGPVQGAPIDVSGILLIYVPSGAALLLEVS